MFIQFVVGLIVTVILCYQLTVLPPLWFGWLCLVLLALFAYLILIYKTEWFEFNWLARFLRQNVSINSWQSRFFHLLFSAIIGMNLVFWQAFFAPTIANEFFNQKNLLEVNLITQPKITHFNHYSKLSFDVTINSLTSSESSNRQSYNQAWVWLKPKIRINWYLDNDEIKALLADNQLPLVGEHWRFYGKLKNHHAAMNITSRDYENWLFQNHLVAKATLSGLQTKIFQNEDSNSNSSVIQTETLTGVRLKSQSYLNWRVLRGFSVEYLKAFFDESPFKAIYLGMTVGDKSAMTQEQWRLFQQTGTIHLMAISGLHMAIMAGMGFWLFRFFWHYGFYRLQRINLPTFTALGGLFFATAYLLLSGAAIPTQRAWIMVVTVLGFMLIKRQFRPWTALAFAAFLIVLWDSRSVLSSGFWLSFMAVSIIFLGLKVFQKKSKWQQFFAIQILLTVGLTPFILWSFYQVPFYGILANLVAVPFVTLIGLPGLVISIFVSLFSIEFGQTLLQWLDWFWQQLWSYLTWLTELPQFDLVTSQYSVFWLFIVSVGFFFLIVLYQILYRKFLLKNRYLLFTLAIYFSVLLLFPYSNSRPISDTQREQAWLTVLDVGQGQAVVIETANHVVVYDAGAKWGASIDAAQVAVIPYLKAQGWKEIDLLIISHSDNDHAGGTKSILEAFNVKQAISGQAKEVDALVNKNLRQDVSQGMSGFNGKLEADLISFKSCQAGQKWLFDGIVFEVLSPFNHTNNKGLKSDNDLSCVLKVTNKEMAFLLMGDLSEKGEKALIETYQESPQKLKANLLLAGHHGSNTSTSQAWLSAVNPQKIVFSSGYLNRYQFPSQEVVERIENFNKNRALLWWNTACSGGLSFELNQSTIELRYESRKLMRKWYHHTCLESQQGLYFQ